VDCKKNERKKNVEHYVIIKYLSQTSNVSGGLLRAYIIIIIILSRDSDHGSHGVYRGLWHARIFEGRRSSCVGVEKAGRRTCTIIRHWTYYYYYNRYTTYYNIIYYIIKWYYIILLIIIVYRGIRTLAHVYYVVVNDVISENNVIHRLLTLFTYRYGICGTAATKTLSGTLSYYNMMEVQHWWRLEVTFENIINNEKLYSW